VVEDLASRGTQLILLVKDTADIFTVDYIDDLRQRHDNQLIYAEQCDLSDLYSVRQFATKFIDNSPPRRLDMVVCCAGLMAPPYTPRTTTKDGVEAHLGVNYLAHFHLLNLLSPLIRVQPPDRDVRVIMATCSSYVLGDLDLSDLQFLRRKYPSSSPWRCYGAAKMAVMIFGIELQRRMVGYKRPDGEKTNVKVYNVDPGMARTPGARRWLTLGSLWGLALYLVMWPFWWLVLKSGDAAAQSFLAAAMSRDYGGGGDGGKLIKECKVQEYSALSNHPPPSNDLPLTSRRYRKPEIADPEVGKQLWEVTEKLIEGLEKESAKKRALAKKSSGSAEEVVDETEQDKELKEKLRKRAVEQTRKKKLLDELIKEEEARGAMLDLPPRVVPKPPTPPPAPGPVVPDTPARNTRSRSKTPAVVARQEGASPIRGPETLEMATKRRTRKA